MTATEDVSTANGTSEVSAIRNSDPLSGSTRKRRPHKKSRNGCRHCKLRRVKCDESKPECYRCQRYGIKCRDRDSSDEDGGADARVSLGHKSSTQSASTRLFNHRTEEIIQLTSPEKFGFSTNQTMLALLNNRGALSTGRPDLSRPLGLADHIFDENDLHALHHWQTVTVQTMGTASSAAMYERELLRLSFIHPYLMHAILTISTLHQRLLLDPGNSIPSYAEYYYWSRTVLLFNANLDTSIREQDRDAMFATGTIMSGISWAWTNTTDPEQSWPNNESDGDESGIETGHPGKDHLEWLNVPRGLRLLIPIARPFRKGSLFAGSWKEQEMHVDPLDHSPVPSIAVVGAGQTDPLDPTARPGTGPREYAALPSQLADLCHVILNCSSPSYFSPASSSSTSIPTSTPQLSSLSSWTPPPAPCPALTIPTPPPNPYSTALRLLSPLFKIDCTRANIIRHIAFLTAVPADFISLLQSRDPRALLILACWYGLILRTSDSWWLVRRARVECGAICVYLDRWADRRGVGVDGGQVDVERRERDKVRELMAFPAEMCGYRTWGGKRREGIGDGEGNRRINEQDEERKAWGWLVGMVGWW